MHIIALALRRMAVLALFALAACGQRHTRVEVRIAGDSVVLAGTLFLPTTAGPHPGVVIVHGFGAQTRDAYVSFATVFAQHGVATLIYDKRGTGESTGSWQHSPFAALADDASAAVDFLVYRAEVDSTRVGIWGGSEGGWIAPWVAARSPRVAFVVTQSAPVVTAEQQHLFQVEQLVRDAGGTAHDVQRAHDYVRMQLRYAATGAGWTEYARQREANRSGVLGILGGPPTPDDWWWAWSRTRMAFDPLAAWRSVSVPILAVWGGRDHNVPVEESRAALAKVLRQSGNRSATLIVIPDANHDLAPTGLGRVTVLVDRATRRIPYYTPSMNLMAEWIATTTSAR